MRKQDDRKSFTYPFPCNGTCMYKLVELLQLLYGHYKMCTYMQVMDTFQRFVVGHVFICVTF